MNNETSVKVPLKYQGMITEIYKDSDGYWAYSNKGFMFEDMGCHTAHEDTQADLLRVIRSLIPCDCDECKEEATEPEQVKHVAMDIVGLVPCYTEGVLPAGFRYAAIEWAGYSEKDNVTFYFKQETDGSRQYFAVEPMDGTELAGELSIHPVDGGIKTREIELQGRKVTMAAELNRGFRRIYNVETGQTLCYVVRREETKWYAIGEGGSYSRLNAVGSSRGWALQTWINAVNREHKEELAADEEQAREAEAMVRHYYGGGDSENCSICKGGGGPCCDSPSRYL